MGISIFNVKKWIKMICNKSLLHVNQEVGQFYQKKEIAGYYNNLTEKVTKDKEDIMIPLSEYPNNVKIYFPIAVFQFGLGAFDLWISTSKDIYKKKFMCCVAWAMNNIQPDGSWKNFYLEFPNSPYSSMAQGEGASLLIRAFKLTNNDKYLVAARKAIDFMLLDINSGGTSQYIGDDLILYEFTCKPYVYNGWMFSIFGLYDLTLVDKNPIYSKKLNQTVATLSKKIENMDNGYWSMYDADDKIASPFYHKLHISLLCVMYDLFKIEKFNYLKIKFIKYNRNKVYKAKAFIKKVVQKLFER